MEVKESETYRWAGELHPWRRLRSTWLPSKCRDQDSQQMTRVWEKGKEKVPLTDSTSLQTDPRGFEEEMNLFGTWPPSLFSLTWPVWSCPWCRGDLRETHQECCCHTTCSTLASDSWGHPACRPTNTWKSSVTFNTFYLNSFQKGQSLCPFTTLVCELLHFTLLAD